MALLLILHEPRPRVGIDKDEGVVKDKVVL